MGLLCAYSAILHGASAVYSVDHVHTRLEKAKSIGATPPHENEVVNNCIRITAETGGIGLNVVYVPVSETCLGLQGPQRRKFLSRTQLVSSGQKGCLCWTASPSPTGTMRRWETSSARAKQHRAS